MNPSLKLFFEKSQKFFVVFCRIHELFLMLLLQNVHKINNGNIGIVCLCLISRFLRLLYIHFQVFDFASTPLFRIQSAANVAEQMVVWSKVVT